MKEKIEKARKLRDLYKFEKSKHYNDDNLSNVFLKCFFLYIFYCIILNEDYFILKIKGRYNKNIFVRIYEWLDYFANYINDCIEIFILKHSKKTKELYPGKYRYYVRFSRPTHIKLSGSINELKFFSYLKRCGFTVTDEDINSLYSIYRIS